MDGQGIRGAFHGAARTMKPLVFSVSIRNIHIRVCLIMCTVAENMACVKYRDTLSHTIVCSVEVQGLQGFEERMYRCTQDVWRHTGVCFVEGGRLWMQSFELIMCKHWHHICTAACVLDHMIAVVALDCLSRGLSGECSRSVAIRRF